MSLDLDHPVLQVALDEVNLHRALGYAKEAVEGGAEWLEAGTPLIKSEGMEAVRRLKKEFPDRFIIADLKTMDTGAFETEMAAKAGADAIGVLGAADNGTIEEAVKAARKYGAKLYVDLISVPDKVQRAKDAARLGADYVCMHVGIDEQMKGGNPVEILKEVARAVDIPVAVAGGLNSETVAEVVKAGASIVIVGGAIIKAERPTEEARKIVAAIRDKKVVPTELFKKYKQEELYAAFGRVSTSNVSDAMHRKGAMFGLRPVQQDVKIVGRAVTVEAMNGDWAKPVEAIDKAGPGDVLVITTQGGHTAVWGELASETCKVRGVEGLVIDGAVRDVDHIRMIQFPVWARHIVPNAGEPKGFGEIGGEIVCGGQVVRNGDWIVADDMGVVVVPQDQAVELANRALDVYEHENRLREEIRRGSSLSKVLKLKKWEKVVG
ncbi:MAG: orotidine 5'-phosphate decarboxylase [Euryarchaeota archaeon]|nr:orotidine 5'-phosphate decarboxylase [Euryarchaeota archaeon]